MGSHFNGCVSDRNEEEEREAKREVGGWLALQLYDTRITSSKMFEIIFKDKMGKCESIVKNGEEENTIKSQQLLESY